MFTYQRGFTAIEIILVAITVAVLGLAGWVLYQNNYGTTEVADTNQEQKQKTETEKEKSNTPEGWTEYRDKELGFSFAYPQEWGEIQVKEDTGSSGKRYFASFSNNSTVSFSGASLDFRAQRGGGVFTGKNKGWEKENSTYYFIRNYSDDRYRSETTDVREFKAQNTTGLYQENLDPSAMREAAEVYTLSFNISSGPYHGLAFAYEVPEEQEGQDTTSQVEEFKKAMKTVEVL